MMGKLPMGVVSPSVKMSSGGCSDPLKFYATSYSTAYGRDEFKPRMGSHEGTGYQSNYRPLVTYQPNMDTVDNPAMREQVRDSLQTVASKSYCPMELPDGKDPLPWSMHQTPSGYGRERLHTGAVTKEVRKVHFDTQDHGPKTITGLEPKEVPLLHQHLDKGSLELENLRYGPRFMTSEYNSKYLKDVPRQPDILHKMSIGPKGETGFTEESTTNPIVFQPPSQVPPGDPILLPSRSVTKSDFMPMAHPQGSDFLPMLARGSERETGYSRVNERTLNPRVPPPSLEPSSRQYQSPQRVQQSNVAMLGRDNVGRKELSGFTLNNPTYFRSSCDPNRDQHYLTTYNQGYVDNTPKGRDWESWTRGGPQPQVAGSYPLHMEATPSSAECQRRLNPHMTRTMTSADPFSRDPPQGSYHLPSS
ncbi:protein phosphatase 1 regulatory subunit 32 [Perognathus longimembris pacificus]|uniref:protein phosphatase 1 regulatory subunit 32 n=1 Tax=Perognathus longimembris pacificus TaxID=214514 RepID=UPI00201884C8|nr:protein phosphatase 1 regulatory subunit 32 [Perognathus longimembris pacificus]